MLDFLKQIVDFIANIALFVVDFFKYLGELLLSFGQIWNYASSLLRALPTAVYATLGVVISTALIITFVKLLKP